MRDFAIGAQNTHYYVGCYVSLQVATDINIQVPTPLNPVQAVAGNSGGSRGKKAANADEKK